MTPTVGDRIKYKCQYKHRVATGTVVAIHDDCLHVRDGARNEYIPHDNVRAILRKVANPDD